MRGLVNVLLIFPWCIFSGYHYFFGDILKALFWLALMILLTQFARLSHERKA